MPNNTYVNKVVYGGSPLIDLTSDDVTAADVAAGVWFHLPSGERVQGTATGGGSVVITETQDVHGGTIKTITTDGSIDLSHDTVDAAHLLSGYTAHDSAGQAVTGSYTPPTARTASDVTVSGATVTVPAGAYASQVQKSVAAGNATAPSTISGTAASVSTGTNTLTLSKTVSVTPTVSAGYVSSGTAGNSSVSLTANVTTQAAQTIYPSATDQSIAASRYLTGAQTIKGVAVANLTAANIKSGVTVTIGDSADADRIMSVTGTYSGGGGSKNVQVAQSTSRASSSTYTKIASLTCSTAGKYDVYWDCFRSTTGGTSGSQLYLGGSAYGTANTTFTNHAQTNHLSNVSIAASQEVAVYARSRGNNYYAYVGTLTIVQSS